jgi:hypothetical protein
MGIRRKYLTRIWAISRETAIIVWGWNMWKSPQNKYIWERDNLYSYVLHILILTYEHFSVLHHCDHAAFFSIHSRIEQMNGGGEPDSDLRPTMLMLLWPGPLWPPATNKFPFSIPATREQNLASGIAGRLWNVDPSSVYSTEERLTKSPNLYPLTANILEENEKCHDGSAQNIYIAHLLDCLWKV